MSIDKYSPELEHLIHEQEKDQSGTYEYPERINPRNPDLFKALTLKEKSCTILHFFMTRKEIAFALGVTENTIKDALRRSGKKLSENEVFRFKKFKKRRINSYLLQ